MAPAMEHPGSSVVGALELRSPLPLLAQQGLQGADARRTGMSAVPQFGGAGSSRIVPPSQSTCDQRRLAQLAPSPASDVGRFDKGPHVIRQLRK